MHSPSCLQITHDPRYIPETRDLEAPLDPFQMPSLEFEAGAASARAAEEIAQESARQQRSEADARMIIRAGFRQVPEFVNSRECMYFWATPPMLQGAMMSHEKALAVGIVTKAKAPITVLAYNAELRDVVVHGCAVSCMGGTIDKVTEGKIIAQCRELIAQGATIEGSTALHAAAASQVASPTCFAVLHWC
jgi:hypothetical protein